MFRTNQVRYVMIAGLLAFVTTTMWAQTKSTKDAAKPAAKEDAETKFRGRLPNGFGKLNISDKQRDEIYGIQKKYFDELQVLVEQIKKIKSARDTQIHDVLTAEQKAALAKDQAQPKASSKTKEDSASSKSKADSES